MGMNDRVFYGSNITADAKDENTVYHMKDAGGEGTMTCYSVYPGIDLMYNDFHMTSCSSEFCPKVEMIGIDHCNEGRIEWEFQNSYIYLQKGDLQISAKSRHNFGFGFPLGHYHGITVAIYVEEAETVLSGLLDGFSVDLRGLRDKFCSGDAPFIMRAKDSIQHIFSELYSVPGSIRMNYYKIKVLELLLFLSAADAPAAGERRPYFPKKQVGTVKEIKSFITANLERHYTLDELSALFDIPLTSMKLCFKGVYGSSIYAFIRNYRMQAAAVMLRETGENIAVIAGKVGYDNASKFAAAFRETMNMSPGEYRKKLPDRSVYCPDGAEPRS